MLWAVWYCSLSFVFETEIIYYTSKTQTHIPSAIRGHAASKPIQEFTEIPSLFPLAIQARELSAAQSHKISCRRPAVKPVHECDYLKDGHKEIFRQHDTISEYDAICQILHYHHLSTCPHTS